MKERPILFSGPMVRAILEGRKTQTRRVVKPQPSPAWTQPPCEVINGCWASNGCVSDLKCPYGVPGDRLWVKETWCSERPKSRGGPVGYAADGVCGYWDATGMFCPHGRLIEAPGYKACFPAEGARTFGMKGYGGRWRPSIHMPRWASRITLEVVSVRVERLQEISEADAVAEGFVESFDSPCGCHERTTAREHFLTTFYDLNERALRGSNPWVWVVEFKRVLA